MNKIAVIATMMAVFLSTTRMQARKDEPRITFGAEWSSSVSFCTAYHYNYFSPDGYRYDEKGIETTPSINGEGLIHVGYSLNENWNLSIYTGFTGISNIHNAVPISFRATRLFTSGQYGDRWLAFADAGTGFDVKRNLQGIFALKFGSGYRFSLSPDSKIDLLVAVRCAYTHPEIYFENKPISHRWTNRNDALVLSISAGMSVTF